jgi:hypothetical protein
MLAYFIGIKLLVAVFLLLKQSECATQTIYPEKPNSVDPFRTNESASGNYTFHFRITTIIKSKPRFVITFPQIYTQILKNPANCFVVFRIVLQNSEINALCSASGNTLVVDLQSYISQLDAGYFIINLQDVKNPSVAADKFSGNFYISSWSGIDISIDSNLSFDAIAFAPAYSAFSFLEVVNDGASTAGYLTNYLIKFGITKEYSIGTWFRLQFPDTYTISSSVQCVLRDLNIALNCTSSNNILYITGLSVTLAKDQVHILKIIGVRNPFAATAKTADFLFESLKQGINTVIDFKDDVPGIAINTGQISDVLIIGFPLVQNLFVDYEVKFLLMNEIPKGGSILITFPPTFQGLDKTCRIISGLTSAPSSSLSCNTVGLTLVISGFANVIPQYINVRCFAYNPPNGGPTPYFQIETFKDLAMTAAIDQNLNAGFVTISSIGKPKFVNFDYYTPIYNCTFNEICPIDFRLFPQITNGLHKSSASTYATVDLQIPQWWWLSGNLNQPECLFGEDSTYQCWQREHIFSIQTPNTRDFEICDLPISVKYSQVTPIPGRYPWRILTYREGGKWNSNYPMKNTINEFATPIEQDTFMMEIPYLGISVLQAYSSSNISGDPDNFLHIRCNLTPFDLSYEGAINLNFTHVEDNLVDRAAWPSKIGFAIADNSVAEFPCKIYISGTNVGIGTTNWNYHRNVRCFIKTGDSSKKENTYVQVVGFNSTLPSGTFFEMFLPKVKFCTTINRLCKLTISYTNTRDLIDPYILNSREVVFGTVVNMPSNPIFPTPIAGTATRTNNQKCQPTELRMTFTSISADIMPGDYVIFSRSLSHWYFLNPSSYQVITPSVSTRTMTAYPIQVPSTNIEYLVIPITERIVAGNNKLFRVLNLFTSPYAGTTDTISAIVYSSKNKINSGSFPIMSLVVDGGIIYQSSSLSDIAGSRNGYYALGYNQPFQLSFDTCLEVPVGGEIIVGLASSPAVSIFQSFNSECTVWENVKFKVGNETHPTCFWDAPSLSFKIRNFEEIPKKTRIVVQFYGPLRASVSSIAVSVNTYPIQGSTANRIDYLNAVANTVSTGVPYVLAPKYEYVNWKEKKGGMYVTNRGYFKITFDPGHNIDYNLAENNYLEFVFDVSITLNSNIYCVYGVYPSSHMYPSVQCDFIEGPVFNTIRMRLHPMLYIQAGTKYIVLIDTRDKEIYEGLTFSRTGIYTLSVYSYVGAVKTRSGKGRFQIYGRRIPHFFIHSSNKVVDDWTLFTIISEWWDTTVSLGVSDTSLLSYQMMVVFFETANNGFAPDLGTGLPELESFPCKVLGVNFLGTKTNVDCTLYWGYNNAPAKIQITGYAASNPSQITVFLPLIKNPASIIVPKVWFQIQNHSIVGGVKQINILYEGHYTELNMTYTKHPNYTYAPLEVNENANVLSHDQTTLEFKGFLTIPIQTTGITLNRNDIIAFKFPLYWPLDVTLATTDCTNIPVLFCYTITNVDRDYHMLVVKLSGNVGTGSSLRVRVKAPIAVVPLTPPAPPNIIKTYIFHHTRLVRIINMTNFSGVNMIPNVITTFSATCDVAGPIEGQQTDYIIKFSLPNELLASAQVRVDAVDFIQVVPFCSNTPNSLMTGNLVCGVNGNYAYIDSFNYLARNQFIEIKIPFTNPAYNAMSNYHYYKVSAYFKASSGFYYLRSTSIDFKPTSPDCDIRQASGIGAANTIWAQMYHQGNFTRTNTIGPINIIISFSQTFTIDNTYYVIIKVPISFVLQSAEFVGIWNENLFARQWSKVITGTHSELTVYFPKTGSITANKQYKLTLTTLNAQTNSNGFLYPISQGVYAAPVEFYANNILTSSATAKIYVWKTSPTAFEAKAAVMNVDEKNLFYVGFKLPAILAASSILKLKIPVLSYSDMNNLNQFDEDGGNGLITGSIVSCYFTAPVVAFTPSCTFTRGNKLNFQSITIDVTGITSPISANTNIILLIDGTKNPLTFSDNNHVFTSLEIYFGGVHLYTGIVHDFTLVSDPYISYVNLTPPTFNSDTIGNTNIQMSLSFTCSSTLNAYSSTTGIGFGDYLIVEFPVGYVLKKSSGTEARTSSAGSSFSIVDVGETNNIILYKPDRVINANVLYTLSLRKFDQAIVKPLNAVFKVSCVNRRSIVSKNIYNIVTSYIAPTFDPALIVITASESIATFIPYSKSQKWTLQFQIPTSITSVPSTGLFDIHIPLVLTEPDLFCENEASSLLVNLVGNSVLCTYDATNVRYTITNFQDIVPNKNIIISFYAKSPATSVVSNIIIRAYKDPSRQYMLMETAKAFPTVSTYPGFNTLKMLNQSGKKDVVRVGNFASFTINVQIPVGWTATSSMDFDFDPLFVSIPSFARMDCYFDNYEAESCIIVSPTPLKIRIKAPNEPSLIIGTTYKISIVPKCGSNGSPGLNYLSAGQTSVLITFGVNSLSVNFEIFPVDFTYVEVRSLFSNKVESNALYFKLKPSVSIPVDGSLIITLPIYNQLKTSQVWTPNASFLNGSFLPKSCIILSLTTIIAQPSKKITCQYFVNNSNMKFIITGFNAISFGVDLEFSINDISLFGAPDESTMVDVIVESIDASSVTLNKRYLTEIMGIVTRTTTSLVKSLNLGRGSKNALQQTNVQYTFTSVNLVKAIDSNSIVVFAFPNNFFFSNPLSNCNSAATPGTYYSFGRYIVFTPVSNIPLGTPNFCIDGITNPKINYTGNLSVYVVNSRFYSQILIYNCPAFTSPTITVAGTTTSLLSSQLNIIELIIDTSITLVSSNYIQIDVPASTEIINFELFAGLTSMTNSSRVVTPTQKLLFILTESYSKASNGVLKVRMIVKNGGAGSQSIVVSLGEDYTTSSQFASGTFTMFLTANTISMTCQAASSHFVMSSRSTISLSTSISVAATTVSLEAPNLSNLGSCEDFSGSVTCAESPIGTFTFNTPTNPSLLTFDIDNPSTAGFSIMNLSIDTTTKCSGLLMYTIKSEFTSFAFSSLHYNIKTSADLPTIWTFDFKPTITILQSEFISVEIFNHDSDLADGISIGSVLACALTVNNVLHESVYCVVQNISSLVARILINRKMDITAGSDARLVIYRIYNPTTDRTVVVNLRHYKYNIGSLADEVAGGSAFYTTLNSIITKSSRPSVSVLAQSLNNLSLTFVAGLTSIDSIFILNSGKQCNKQLASLAALPTDSSYYESNCAVESINLVDPTLSLTDLEFGLTSSTQSIYAILVENAFSTPVVKEVITIPSTISKKTFTSISVTQNSVVNSIITYRFIIAIDKIVPQMTFFEITFPTSFSNIMLNSFTGVDLSRVTGTITATTNNQSIIYLKNYNYISTGSIEFLVSIQAIITGSTWNNASIKIKSEFDSSILYEALSQTIAYTAPVIQIIASIPNSFVSKNEPLFASQFGRLEFIVSFKSTYASTDVLYITPDATFPVPSSRKYQCKFMNMATKAEYFSQYTFYNSVSKRFEVQMPVSNTLSPNILFQIELYSFDDIYYGITLPSTTGTYGFILQLYTSAIALKEQFKTYLTFATQKPSYLCFKNYVSNPSYENILTIRYKPQTTLASSVVLNVILSTQTILGGVLQNSALPGLSNQFLNRESIGCRISTMTLGSTSRSLSAEIFQCRLLYGSALEYHKPVKIEIILASSLSSSTLYQIDIYNFYNPSATQQFVSAWLEVWSGALILESAYSENILYTSNPAIITEAAGNFGALTAASQTNLALVVPVNTASSVSLTSDEDSIFLSYNTEFYQNTISTSTLSMDLHRHNSNKLFFVAKSAVSTNLNLNINNLSTGKSATVVNMAFSVWVVRNKLIRNRINYSGTFTSTTIPFTSMSVVSTNYIANTLSPIQLTVVFSKDVLSSGCLVFQLTNIDSFKPGFVEVTNILGSSVTWVLETTTRLVVKNINAITNGSTLTVKFLILSQIVAGQSVSLTVYNDHPGTLLSITQTSQIFTGVVIFGFPYLDVTTFERPNPIRGSERGPLTFSITPTINLTKRVDRIDIVVDPLFAVTYTDDFICKFDNMLSALCYYNSASTSFIVYAPRENNLILGTTYILQINSIREIVFSNNLVSLPFPIPAQYNIKADFYIGAVKSATSVEISHIVPPYRWAVQYLNTFLIQKNAYSIYRLQIQNTKLLMGNKLGRIVISFPTLDSYGRVYENNLGTSYYHGQQFDCLSGSMSTITYTCFIFFGNGIIDSSIIIYTTPNMVVSSVIEVFLAPILNPIIDMTEAKIRVSGQNFDAVNLIWNTIMEYSEYIFVATDITISVVNKAMPVFTPGNKVGEKSSVTFNLLADANIKTPVAGGFDRIIMTVDKSQLVLLNDQSVVALKFLCAGWTINIYKAQSIIEFASTSSIAQGANINLSCTTMFNQQYVIPGGVSYTLDIFSDGFIAKRYVYAANLVVPNLLINKVLTYKNVDLETSSFDTYDFKIKTTNKVPSSGFLSVEFSDQFTDVSNCEVYGGITGVCIVDIIGGGLKRLRLTLKKPYDPAVDNDVFFKVDMTNPATPGTYSFTFVSYYNYNEILAGTNYAIIDKEVITSFTYIGSIPFDYFLFDPPFSWIRECCPDGWNFGVFQFKVAFSQTLSYDNNDTISVVATNLYLGAYYTNYLELLCYFDIDSIRKSIKSENCVQSNNGVFTMLIPEEVSFTPLNDVLINIEYRGTNRGVVASLTPMSYYFIITNSKIGNEVAIVEFPVRACYFSNSFIDVVHWHQDMTTTLEFQLYAWKQINFRTGTGGQKVRFQVIFSTWNEIKQTQYLDMGFTSLTAWNDTISLPCYMHSDWSSSLTDNVYNPRDVYCEFYKGNVASLDYPLIGTINSITDGSMNYFRGGFGPFTNYKPTSMDCNVLGFKNDGNRNTYTHITLQAQVLMSDGTYTSVHSVTQWYSIAWIIPPITPTMVVGDSATMSNILQSFYSPTYTLNIAMSSTITSDYVYYDLSAYHDLLPRNETDYYKKSSSICNFYPGSTRRYLFYLSATYSSNSISFNGYAISPSFSNTVGVKVYITRFHSIVRYITGTITTNTNQPDMILENNYPDNPRSALVLYRLAVYFNAPFSRNHRYMRYYIPSVFTNAQKCNVKFGFIAPDSTNPLDKMQCRLTTGVTFRGIVYTLMEVFNIYHWSALWRANFYENQFIIEVWLQNPPTSMWTPEWHTEWFDNYNVLLNTYDNTRIQLTTTTGSNKARFWVGETVPLTNYFRVFRNRETFEERRQLVNEWAELHLRVYPSQTIPADIGLVEVNLPQNYDIPDGGTKICEVGHNYHDDLSGQFCEITNERKIRVRTSQSKGLESVCTIVRVTTEDSIGGYDGFQAPAAWEDQAADIFLWQGTQLLEYSSSDSSSKSKSFEIGTSLNITCILNEINEISTLIVKFTVDQFLNFGYDNDPKQTDIFKKNPITNFVLTFNTYDRYNVNYNGFPFDLGYPLTTSIPCQTIKNMLTKPNEDLKCVIESVLTSRDFYIPIKMIVSNFQSIQLGTEEVEFHILDIKWTGNLNNMGTIGFGILELKGDGSNTIIYENTEVKLLSQGASGVVASAAPVNSLFPTLIPNNVGAKISFKIGFSLTSFLIEDDFIEVKFPTQFVFPDQNELSAIINAINSVENKFKSIGVIAYPVTNKLLFAIPRGFTVFGCTVGVPCQVILTVAGLRNAAYAFTTNYSLSMRVIGRKITLMKLNFNSMTPPTVSLFNSLLVTQSSEFSGDINVTYNFMFVPSYVFPAGTKITLTLNAGLFGQIHLSSPPAACKTNFNDKVTSCTITSAKVEIILSSSLLENFQGSIELTGVKNPTYVGNTPLNCFVVSAIHPSTFAINTGVFNGLTYKPQKNIGVIFINIQASSSYKTVESDYTFVLQNTNKLSANGFINLLLPKDWIAGITSSSIIENIVGSFAINKLIFNESVVVQGNGDFLVKILTKFEWPSKSQLKISIKKVKNPSISVTSAFIVTTIYDSVNIDQSDINDPSSKVSFIPYEPKLSLVSFNFSPINEAEISNYIIVLSSKEIILKNSIIQIIFSDAFEKAISDPEKSIICASKLGLINTCTVVNKIVSFTVLESIGIDKPIDVTISGVMNPNENEDPKISVAIKYNGSIIQFTNNLIVLKTITAPKHFPLVYLNATSLKLLEKTTYTFCMYITDPIPKNAKIFIDFPKQFELKDNNYNCTLGEMHDSINLPYNITATNRSIACNNYNKIRRIEISGQLSGSPGGSPSPSANSNQFKFCYKINLIENAQDAGQSFNFQIRVFDSDQSKVLYRTSGILEYPSSLFFFQYGLKIFVSTIEPIPIGLMSKDVAVTLERSVPYDVYLIPSAAGFTFEPSVLTFKFYLAPVQTFRINPANITSAGTYKISWKKVENPNNLPYEELMKSIQNSSNTTTSNNSSIPNSNTSSNDTNNSSASNNTNITINSTNTTNITVPSSTSTTTFENKFSEVSDTYFDVIASFDLKSITITIAQVVYKCPLNSQTLPIVLKLSQPSSKTFKIYYKTVKPNQEDQVEFKPNFLEIKAGQVIANLTILSKYKTISGLVEFSLDPQFNKTFYMPVRQINLEILPIDQTAPVIVSTKVYYVTSNSVKFRISVNENAQVFYLITRKHTPIPDKLEIIDPAKRNISAAKPTFPEYQGNKFVNITDETTSYVYNDIYDYVVGLEEDTDYITYALPIDLSGNIGEIKSFQFKTNKVEDAVSFTLKSKTLIDEAALLNSLSLVSGLLPSQFKIIKKPNADYYNSLSDDMRTSLKEDGFEYVIQVDPDINIENFSPMEVVRDIDDMKDSLYQELPMLDPTFDIGASASEVHFSNQNFTYTPFLVDVSTFHATFNVSTINTGNLYGIILKYNQPRPTAQQIKYGLDSKNRKLKNTFHVATNNTVDLTQKYKVWPSKLMNFTFLYHTTHYDAYFVAENDRSYKNQLMKDEDVCKVSIVTKREIFVIDESKDYVSDV